MKTIFIAAVLWSQYIFASGITETLTGWTLGFNQPQLDSGARGDGTTGIYHYLPVGTDAYYYEAPTAGEGFITFWIYDPAKCMSSTNPGYDLIGPMWGLRNPNSQAFSVGIARQNFVAGCLGYEPWSTVAPYSPFWLRDGIRGSIGIPWPSGWYKWTIDGRQQNISFTLYNVMYYDESDPYWDEDIRDLNVTYDATTYNGMWASVFGFGWNGFWLKGDGTNGIEDIKVDVIGGTGIFEDCGRTNYYTISGHVYTSDTTTGMSGVIISGGQAGSVTTNANGYYCVSVIEGWSGTVVPSKAGYRFSPANSSYTNVQANQSQSFTGEVTTHYISGHVYKNCTKTGLSGVTVTYSNAGCDTIDSVITDTSGYFIHTVQYGWSGTIAPSLVGYVFFPSNISFYNVQSFSWGWVINGFSTSYYNISLRLDSISGSGGVLSDTVRINYSFTDSSGSLGRVENFYYSIGDTLSWTLVGQSALVDNTYRREGSYSFGWDSREQFPDSSAMDVYIKFNLEHDQIIDTWSTSVGSLSDARERLACGVVNGKIYAIGGYSVRGAVLWVDVYKNRAEEYNPATNTWTTKAPMSMNRCFLAACGLNGKVYALGGGNSTTASNFTATNLVEEYDPSTDTWTIKTPMPTARYGLVVAAVNGKIYAIGGDSAGGGLNTVEEYDPKTDTWAAKAPMPTKRYHMAAGVIDNKIYVAGGLNTTWISTLEVYDPATDTWESKASMPINNYGLGGEVVNGRLYVIGGSNSSDEITNVYEYDPVANNWTAKTFMPWPRYYFGTGVVADGIYVVGGSHIVPLYTVLRYNATRFPSNYVVSPLLTIKNEPQTGFMPFPAIYCDQTTVLQVENPAKVIAIGITVPKNERVKLEIADINGNTVATLADDMLLAGKHKFNLNEPVNTGIYFIKLMTKEYTETRRVLILQ